MSEAVSVPFDKSEVISQTMRQAKAFDRKIRRRNWTEYAAGVLLVVVCTGLAVVTDGLLRMGGIAGVLGAGWVMYFLKRHGATAPDPDPQLSLAEYRDALLEKYDRQIWLLKNVKLWYLLPLYPGMMLIYAGGRLEAVEARGRAEWTDFVYPVFATLFFIFVWWLNEGYSVRKLRHEREQLRKRLDQEN